MTYESPENKIRRIMAKTAGVTLNEGNVDPGQHGHMAPALKTPEEERLSAAVNILKNHGVPSAEARDNYICISAEDANKAADVLERAMAHGLIQVRPQLQSAEAIPMPEPHVPAPEFAKEAVQNMDLPDAKDEEDQTPEGKVEDNGQVELKARTLRNRMENQLKKVDEEQIDELSTETLHKVAKAARKKGRKDVLDAAIRANKRNREKPEYKFAGEEVTDEIPEVQQLDELSLKKLFVYAKAANKARNPLDKKIENRKKGLKMAATKISNKVFAPEGASIDMLKRVRMLSEIAGERLKAVVHSECGKHCAKIYRNAELGGEHRVAFHINGKHHEPADYFTDDYHDAHGTANHELKRLSKFNGALKESTEEEVLDFIEENFEQIDELSKALLDRYVRKAHGQYKKLQGQNYSMISTKYGGYDNNPNKDKIEANYKIQKRRDKGKALARAKIRSMSGTPAKVAATEEVEQVDEVSKKLVGRYVRRAADDLQTKAETRVAHMTGLGDSKPTQKSNNKHLAKTIGRRVGIYQASRKLDGTAKVRATNEEVTNEGLSSHMKKKGYGIADTSTYINTGTAPNGGYEVPGKDVRVGPKKYAAYSRKSSPPGAEIGPERTDVRKAKKDARKHSLGEVAEKGDLPFLAEANIREVTKKLEHHGYKKFGESDKIDHKEVLTTFHHPDHGHLVSVNHTELGRVNSASALKCTNPHTGEMEKTWGADHSHVEHALRELGHKSHIGFKEEALLEDADSLIKVGSYRNEAGEVLNMHHFRNNPKHHVLVHRGKVVAHHVGKTEDFHKELTSHGLTGYNVHEDTQIDELSKPTLARYARKAATNIVDKAFDYGRSVENPAIDSIKYGRETRNRRTGIKRAVTKLQRHTYAKEETQIDEISSDLARSYFSKAARKLDDLRYSGTTSKGDRQRRETPERGTKEYVDHFRQRRNLKKGIDRAINRITEAKSEFTVEPYSHTSVKVGDNHEKVWSHRGHTLYREKENPSEHMLVRSDNTVHSMYSGHTADVKHMIKHAGLERLEYHREETIVEGKQKIEDYKRKHVQGLYHYHHFENPKNGHFIQVHVRDKNNIVHSDSSGNPHKKFTNFDDLKKHVESLDEDVQINELSKGLLKRYMNKAENDMHAHGLQGDMYSRIGHHKAADIHYDKGYSRYRNIGRAGAKRNTERMAMGSVDTKNTIKKRMYIDKEGNGHMARVTASEETINETRMPSSVIKHKQKLSEMPDKDLAERYKKMAAERPGKSVEELARSEAWRHGYGQMSPHYWNRIKDHIKEETQIDELSTATLTKYTVKAAASKDEHIKKATKGFIKSNSNAGEPEVKKKQQVDAQKHARISLNRHMGIRRATNKIATKAMPTGVAEEEQIDELSSNKLLKYVSKASKDAAYHGTMHAAHSAAAKTNHLTGDSKYPEHAKTGMKHRAKKDKRLSGIDKAVDKIAKS